MQSRGINEYGSLRNVTFKRNSQPDALFDFMICYCGGKPSTDSLLENDVIFLPKVENRVLVKGEVARPAFYELEDSNTLEDILEIAGGFTSQAYADEIRLFRKTIMGIKF